MPISNPINTRYNKAVAAGVVGPAITVICIAAIEYFTGETLSAEVKGAILTLATTVLVYAIPNKVQEPAVTLAWAARSDRRKS